MKNTICTLIASIIFSWVCNGQGASYTLADCIRIATEQNLKVAQAKNLEDQSQLSLRLKKSNRLPTLSFGTNVGESFGRSVDPTTNQFISQNFNSIYSSLSSSINLFNGFSRKHAIDLAQSNLMANSLLTKSAQWDTKQLIIQQYFQYWLIQEKLNAVQESIQLNKKGIYSITAMIQAGRLAKLDLLQANEQLMQDSISYASLSNEKVDILNNIKTVMAIPLNQNITLLKPADRSMDILEVNNKDSIFTWTNNHPSLLAQKQQIQSAKIELKLTKSLIAPSLNFGVNIGSNYSSLALQTSNEVIPYIQQMETNLRTNAQLNFQIPILTSNNRKVLQDINKFKIKYEEAKLKGYKQEVKQKIIKAYGDLALSQQNYHRHTVLLKNTDEMFKQAKRQFELGMINTYEYLEIKNKYRIAQIRIIELKYNFLFKNKILMNFIQ